MSSNKERENQLKTELVGRSRVIRDLRNLILTVSKLDVPVLLTGETPASFEPSIDYVVTKIPRFAFKKFPQADPTLTTQAIA